MGEWGRESGRDGVYDGYWSGGSGWEVNGERGKGRRDNNHHRRGTRQVPTGFAGPYGVYGEKSREPVGS